MVDLGLTYFSEMSTSHRQEKLDPSARGRIPLHLKEPDRRGLASAPSWIWRGLEEGDKESGVGRGKGKK